MLPTGVQPAAVRVRHGRIASIEGIEAPAGRASAIDCGDAMLLPGLVDTHVHVNEPGRTEWEGFESATRAAAAGGVTTLLDMPLNSIPATTTHAAFREKLDAASGKCHVDVGFIGGVVPGNEGELEALANAGVLAWKCFLVDSGVPEFAAVDEPSLRSALRLLAPFDRPLMVHAEHPDVIARARREGVLRSYASYAATRPEEAEQEAIGVLLEHSDTRTAPVHIVHLASRKAAVFLESVVRRANVRMTAETCPHYLTFASEEIPDGATEYKCAPPIRSAVHRDALWDALQRGTISSIASDHSPSPPDLKRRDEGDFGNAWGGIASLQLGLSAVWRGARARGVDITRVIAWMATNPAALVRLSGKGRIVPGADADLVVWDPDAEWTVDATRLFHRQPITPYDGMRLPGRVRSTYLAGRLIFDEGECIGPPAGKFLLRPRYP